MMEQKFTGANKGRENKTDFSSIQLCFKLILSEVPSVCLWLVTSCLRCAQPSYKLVCSLKTMKYYVQTELKCHSDSFTATAM